MNHQITSSSAVEIIKSGDRVFIHGGAATPSVLLNALFNRKAELKDVELVSITTIGENLFTADNIGNSFFVNSLFVSTNVREVVNSNHGEYGDCKEFCV